MSVPLTKKQVEEMLDVDQRTLTRYQSREIDPLPILVKGKRGTANTYCAKVVLNWRLRRLKEEQDKSAGGDGLIMDYEKERARLTHGQADKVEMETAIMRGELIPSSIVKDVQCDMVARVRSRLLSIPTKSAHALIGKSDLNEVQAVLKENIYEALNELAEYRPEDYGIITDISGDIIDMEATT